MPIFVQNFSRMENITAFVKSHLTDDTTRLILDKAKWPDIDMDLAVNCIESRRKLRGKVQEWYDNPDLIFPYKLSAEQCSSSSTARYKADLAARIASSCHSGLDPRYSEPSTRFSRPDIRHSEPSTRLRGLDPESLRFQIADLTGGLGVDSWFFSKKAGEVLYNEMQPKLCEAAAHNFKTLGSSNIRCSCAKAEAGRIAELLDGFIPDIIFMDPARRGEGGKKVFLLEDCTPDILTLKDEIFTICRHILLKLSPMADITMACERLGSTCREVHVVATGGECKELLIWIDREWSSEYTVHAVELPTGRHSNTLPDRHTFPLSERHSGLPSSRHSGLDPESTTVFTFTPSEEKSASHTLGSEGLYLFEPGKALMKSGAFNLISKRFSINKLGQSTHYYLVDDESIINVLADHGKIFRILDSMPLDKRSIKAAAKTCPKAEVTARNILMDTDTLRKKLGCSPSDTYHIFGLKSDLKGALLLVTEHLFF